MGSRFYLIVAMFYIVFPIKAQEFEVDVLNIKKEISNSLDGKNFGIQFSLMSNEIEFNHSAGFKSPVEKLSNENTFNIGSTTKLITSLLILKAVEERKLRLDDKIRMYFNGNINVDSEITIKNLLQHTSGLRGGVDAKMLFESFMDSTTNYSNGSRYNLIEKTTFKPNSSFHYCNYNYHLLGYILEKVYSKSYFELVQERIIDRYKLENTSPYTICTDANLTDPFLEKVSYKDSTNTNYYRTVCFSAGCINSNSTDVCRLLYNVFIDKNFVSRSSIDKLIKSTINKNGESQYGFGIEEEYNKDGLIYYGHQGDNLGYGCRIMINVEKKLVGCILFNTLNEWKIKGELFRRMMRIQQ